MERAAPSTRWVGSGTGILIGLGVAEVLSMTEASLAGIVFAAGMTVVLDRVIRRVPRAVLGVAATSVAVYSLATSQNCLDIEIDPSLVAAGIVAAGLAWLASTVIGSRPGVFNWFTDAGNLGLLLFGLTEVAIFVLSPAGIPIAVIHPPSAIVAVLLVTGGLGVLAGRAPEPILELIGWTLGLSQIFIFGYLLTSASEPTCSADAVDAAAAATTGALVAMLIRFGPGR